MLVPYSKYNHDSRGESISECNTTRLAKWMKSIDDVKVSHSTSLIRIRTEISKLIPNIPRNYRKWNSWKSICLAKMTSLSTQIYSDTNFMFIFFHNSRDKQAKDHLWDYFDYIHYPAIVNRVIRGLKCDVGPRYHKIPVCCSRVKSQYETPNSFVIYIFFIHNTIRCHDNKA